MLSAEFASIYLYSLRGNGRIAGEEGRKEGRPVFEFGGWRPDGTEIKSTDGGSRATIAIIVLVKNSAKTGPAAIRYAQVDDYLSAGEKIRAVTQAGSVGGLALRPITPDKHGDWFNQRTDDFQMFLPLGAKHGEDTAGPTIFKVYGRGLETGRDAWVYQSSATQLRRQVAHTISAYNAQVEDFKVHLRAHRRGKPKDLVKGFIDLDSTHISLSLKNRLASCKGLTHNAEQVLNATYRPFFKQHVYFDQGLNHIRGQTPRFFPTPRHTNLGFYIVGVGSDKPFSALATTVMPDLALWGSSSGQFFPRWTWEPVGDEHLGFDGGGQEVDGYRQDDNVTDEALSCFTSAFGPDWTKDDVFFYCYGVLHSAQYRQTYAADLKKGLPRIPLVASIEEARAFVEAGRRLSELHTGYESVTPYPLDGLDAAPRGRRRMGRPTASTPWARGRCGSASRRRTRLPPGRSMTVVSSTTTTGSPCEGFPRRPTVTSWALDRVWSGLSIDTM